MTNLISLTDALAPVRDLYTEPVAAATAWQAGRARRTDPDHLTLICLGADRTWGSGGPLHWTRTSVFDVLRIDIPHWCSVNRCLWPEQLPEAMWEWFDFLDETGRLAPGSDPLGELRKPLLCYGRLDQRGVRLPVDAPSTIVCECLTPYRESAEILLQLAHEEQATGVSPLEHLRSLVGRGSRHGQAWE